MYCKIDHSYVGLVIVYTVATLSWLHHMVQAGHDLYIKCMIYEYAKATYMCKF